MTTDVTEQKTPTKRRNLKELSYIPKLHEQYDLNDITDRTMIRLNESLEGATTPGKLRDYSVAFLNITKAIAIQGKGEKRHIHSRERDYYRDSIPDTLRDKPTTEEIE